MTRQYSNPTVSCVYMCFTVYHLLRRLMNSSLKFVTNSSATSLLAKVFTLSLLLVICYWVLDFIDTETYVLQCTSIAALLRPVRRSTCELSPTYISDENHRSLISQVTKQQLTHNTPHDTRYRSHNKQFTNHTVRLTRNEEISSQMKTHRIAIVFLYDGRPSGGNGNDGGQSWNSRLMQRVIRNREVDILHGY